MRRLKDLSFPSIAEIAVLSVDVNFAIVRVDAQCTTAGSSCPGGGAWSTPACRKSCPTGSRCSSARCSAGQASNSCGNVSCSRA